MLVWGSYPAVWTSDTPRDELSELVRAYILRDASDRFRIARPDAFRLLLRLAAGQVGDLVAYAEWAALMSVSAPTVRDYVGLLEETHAVVAVRPFVGGKRAELTRAPQVYFIDNGLRNELSGGFLPLSERADGGKLLENWVFGELHKRFPEPGGVRYWRTKGGAEVDFVLEPTAGKLVGLEVKAHRAGGRFKLSRGARSFIDAYRPHEFLLVHRGEAHEVALDDTRVRWIPAAHLPETLDALLL